MKRLLLAVLFASFGLAQIPSDTVVSTLVQRATARRAFLAAHPNAREILRREDAVHFDVNGTRTAIFQSGIAHVDPDSGEITPTDLDLVQTQAGYRTVGSPIVVRVVEGPLVGGNPTSMVQTFRKDPVDKTVMGYAIVTAPLTYQSDFRFTFQQQGLSWELKVAEFGWDLQAAVASTQGAKTYRFGYDEVNMTLDPDADGNLAIPSGRYKITRPVMIRADGITTPCDAWQVDRAGVRIGFTCDDSSFPPAAYPYAIDPSAQFTASAVGDRYYTDAYQQTSSAEPDCFYTPGGSTYIGYSATTGFSNVRLRSYARSDGSGCLSERRKDAQFVRFNTSSLTGMTLNSASLTYNVSVWAAEAIATNSCGTGKNVNWDWVTPSWPPVYNDNVWSDTCSSGNAAGPESSQATGARTVPLGNIGSINRAGYTYLRGSMNAAASFPYWDAADHFYGPSFAVVNPYITVDYNLPGGPKLIVVTESGN